MHMLEEGLDTKHLRTLAGWVPPFNQFEIAALRDRALEELGYSSDDDDPARQFSVELLRDGLSGRLEMHDALRRIRDLSVALDYRRDLFDFYLLSHAWDDIIVMDAQGYWPSASRDNIADIARIQAIAFVHSPSDTDDWPKTSDPEALRFPVLCLSRDHSISPVDTLDRLRQCNARAFFENRWFDDLLIIDSDASLFRVVSSLLQEAKGMVLHGLEKEPDFWEAAFDLTQWKTNVNKAGDVRALIELFR